jgi:hypothetical protein
MIHRITSVAPDLDDRVIKPNQARSATNMRFGASSEDNNLSGGILVNGMELIDFNPNITLVDGSQSTSLVIGVKEDYENQYVYYAIYSNAKGESANHGILQINTKTDAIQWVVRGSWLNFLPTSNVSMTVINGLLYFTDNVNEPRMINIEKGIRTFNGVIAEGADLYPLFTEANTWLYSQIKRAPQVPLNVSISNNSSYPTPPLTNTFWVSSDYAKGFQYTNYLSSLPYQFSYFYVYDNNEESRLAPWTKATFYINDLVVEIPTVELETYCDKKNNTIVRYIVIVMRRGNEGTIYTIKKWDVSKIILPNDEAPIGGSALRPILTIPSLTSINSTPTPESIHDQRYDSVPLLSATNEIANNILNHANVVTEYTDYGDLGILVNVVKNDNTTAVINKWSAPIGLDFDSYKTFKPGANYNVGIQLIDEYGRVSPVLNTTSVDIPNTVVGAVLGMENPGSTISDRVRFPTVLNPSVFNDDAFNNQYSLDVSVTGELPSWAKYVRVCYTKNNTVNFFNKTVSRIYFWYQSGNKQNLYIRCSNNSNSIRTQNLETVIEEGTNTKYTFKGYAVEVTGGFPFLYASDEEQYVKISREYYLNQDPITGTGSNAPALEYKIVGQDGALFLVDEVYSDVKLYTGYQVGDQQSDPSRALWYQVEFYSKKKAREVIYYDAPVQTTRESFVVGNFTIKTVRGDCYLSPFRKTFAPQTVTPYNFTSFTNGEWRVAKTTNYTDGGYTVVGTFVSMNLTNIWDESWNSDYGLINIAQTTTQGENNFNLNTSIVFSNQYIRGTVINGLSKFNPLNIRQAPAENGPITSLVVTNATQQEPGVMLAVGSLGISSFYYGAIQLTNVDGSSNLATTDQHLASQRPLLGQFGTSNAASITKTPLSTVYWWSDVVNDFIRYTNAGLERLGLTYSFNNKLRQDAYGKFVVTGYDQVSDEAILIPKNTRTFIFSERYKSFQGYRELYDTTGQTPERVLGMSIKTYFFLNGFVYVSKIDSEKNKFFDATAVPQLTLVTNEFPSVVKQWNSIKVFGPKPTSTNIEVGEAEGYFLKTEIQPSWWIQRKGEYNASVRRSTANGGDGTSGKVMESRILYSTFVFDVAAFEKLNFIEVKSNTAIVQ